MNSPLSKAGSPISRSRRQTGVSTTAHDARQSRVEAGLVERLFSEGKVLCDAGRFDEAEEKWKQVLQVHPCASNAHVPSVSYRTLFVFLEVRLMLTQLFGAGRTERHPDAAALCSHAA